MADSKTSPSKRTVLITGANQGIGYCTALLLAQSSSGYHILVGSRSLSRGEAAVESLTGACSKVEFTPVQLDVTDDSSIQSAFNFIKEKYGRLDVLINNAGISIEQRADSKDKTIRQVLQEIYSTNVFGAAAVTETFLPLLRHSQDARLIFISSELGSLGMGSDPKDPHYNVGLPGYRSSKAALNMLMVQYSKTLGKEGMKVWGLCPGYLATNLSGDAEKAKEMGAGKPEDGAKVIVGVVEGKRDGEVGKVVVRDGGVAD
ncbi:MAG: hypothetical protein Q9187_007716, partial [Circinaria calcarea]